VSGGSECDEKERDWGREWVKHGWSNNGIRGRDEEKEGIGLHHT